MGVSTYIKYMTLGMAILGLTATGVRSQDRPVAQTPATPQATENCTEGIVKSEALQRELREMQRQMRASIGNIQARAMQVQAEVAREMAQEGMKREELANLAARLQSEEGIAAQTPMATEKAQQLFAHAPGLLDSDEDTGWLGLEMTEITSEKAKELKLSSPRGVQVTHVLADGPAAKAGLESDDVILEFDGQPVEGMVQFRRLVRETPPGRSVDVTISRNGHEQKLTIQVGSAHNQDSETVLREVLPARTFNFNMESPELFFGMTPVLGIDAEDVGGQLGQYFRVPGDEGVLVREVNAGTPAAKAGLKAGDVITKVGGAEVRTVDELRAQLREKREQKTVPLTVVRQGSQVTITVTLESPEMREPKRISSAAL